MTKTKGHMPSHFCKLQLLAFGLHLVFSRGVIIHAYPQADVANNGLAIQSIAGGMYFRTL